MLYISGYSRGGLEYPPPFAMKLSRNNNERVFSIKKVHTGVCTKNT